MAILLGTFTIITCPSYSKAKSTMVLSAFALRENSKKKSNTGKMAKRSDFERLLHAMLQKNQ